MNRVALAVVCALAQGCAQPQPWVSTSTTYADGAILMAQLSNDGKVTVEGTFQAPLYVDLDGQGDPLLGEDARYAFRYRVLSGDETRYSRSTPGPVIVDAFLDYYSGSVDIDILSAFPGLGEFPIMVPLLPDADRVVFEVRDDAGVYQEVGSYDLWRIDADDVGPSPVVVGHTMLHESGPSQNRLDVVILGDGYTEAELGQWEQDAAAAADALLHAAPFDSFAGLINVHRVDAVSNESGASFDCVNDECVMRDTAFGTVFAIEAVNRMLGSDYRTSPVFQLEQWEVARAAATVPWDMVLIITNAEHDGGFAVHYATVPRHRGWEDTAVHELGHTIGLLGDEYTSDACVRSGSLGLPDNIAEDPNDLPWAAWVESDTPLPTPEGEGWDDRVGAFAPAYNCEDLYRAAHTCRMDNSEDDFCPVCQELLVRRILRFADPLDEVVIAADGTLSVKSPWPTLTMQWTVDGAPAGSGLQLKAPDASSVTLDVTLETEKVREDRGDLSERWSFVRGG